MIFINCVIAATDTETTVDRVLILFQSLWSNYHKYYRGHWVQTCMWLILSANLTKRKKWIRICGSNQWQKRADGGECVKIMSLNPKEQEILNMWSCQLCISQVPLFLMSEYSLCSFLLKKGFCTRKSTADQKSRKKQWKCFLGLKLDCNSKLIILTMILWKVQFETAVQSKKKTANVFFYSCLQLY